MTNSNYGDHVTGVPSSDPVTGTVIPVCQPSLMEQVAILQRDIKDLKDIIVDLQNELKNTVYVQGQYIGFPFSAPNQSCEHEFRDDPESMIPHCIKCGGSKNILTYKLTRKDGH